ncbi:hypothetical protein TNIN_356661 [Trichonephila inaurata madagascariensis]|uniref:Uncharacterized protein n=1 Tax=Trichonephila inaurata madagascariensis TaxID=2747483 RepID=A0A8X6M926_9ARAC|nr:hypothetical protein TNIN_356661 [Trichonephila inaurata madagascariensis]
MGVIQSIGEGDALGTHRNRTGNHFCLVGVDFLQALFSLLSGMYTHVMASGAKQRTKTRIIVKVKKDSNAQTRLEILFKIPIIGKNTKDADDDNEDIQYQHWIDDEISNFNDNED